MGMGWQCEGLLHAAGADDGALSIIGKQHARTDKEGIGGKERHVLATALPNSSW